MWTTHHEKSVSRVLLTGRITISWGQLWMHMLVKHQRISMPARGAASVGRLCMSDLHAMASSADVADALWLLVTGSQQNVAFVPQRSGRLVVMLFLISRRPYARPQLASAWPSQHRSYSAQS